MKQIRDSSSCRARRRLSPALFNSSTLLLEVARDFPAINLECRGGCPIAIIITIRQPYARIGRVAS